MSRVEALEAKNSTLKRDLITAMDKANTVKEKAKLTLEKDEQLLTPREKLKTIAAKAVEAFQQTESTTLCFSVSTSRALNSFVGTWLSILLE